MSKLDGIKAKLAGLLAAKEKLAGILAKIPFLKKFSRQAASAPAKPQAAGTKEVRLKDVYNDGTVLTRLGVVFVFIFFLGFLYFGGGLVRSIWKYQRSKPLDAQSQEAKIAAGLSKQLEHVQGIAAIISLGRITANAVYPNGKPAALNVDVYAECDSPETAQILENVGLRLHGDIIEVFRKMAERKVSPLTEEGRELARVEIVKQVNKTMQQGKIKNVSFYNLVIQ